MNDETWNKLIKLDPVFGFDPYKEGAEPINKGSNSYFGDNFKNIQKLFDESIVNDLVDYIPKRKVEVKIVNDNDGHTYIIPACMKQEFNDLLFEAELSDDYGKFNDWFSKYMKNPDDLKLYTDEI